MEHSSKSFGRMELAQLYFPYILPRSAWQKLKSLLDEDPSLKHLTLLILFTKNLDTRRMP